MPKMERIVTKTSEYQEPKTVTEKRTVQEPKTVMEKRTIEVPKTVMESREVEQPKTVMETKYREELLMMSCSSLSGVGIVNEQGEDLGQIEDVMIDVDSWKVAYVAVSFKTGFLGSSKLFAIPGEAFTIKDADRDNFYQEGLQHKVILNIPQQAFKDADGFDKDNWPRKADLKWLNGVYNRYGYTPYWKETGSSGSSGMRESDTDTARRAKIIESEAKQIKSSAKESSDQTRRKDY